MRISTDQETLQRGLSVVSRAVATRSTLPQTGHVCIATDGERLKLSATNLEIAITNWITATVEDEGAITIPARLLTDFIATLPNEKITLGVAARSKRAEIIGARSETTISGMDADDFPPIPTISDAQVIRLEPSSLREAIEHVVFAAATDDSRPVLTGVHVKIAEDRLTLAAADGFRLAVFHVTTAEAPAETVEVIIPARALQELGRLLPDREDPVALEINAARSTALFRLSDVELTAQLIQGTFPAYDQLIPAQYQTRVILNAGDFLREVRTAAVFARDGSGIVRLESSGAEDGEGKLTIRARAEEQGDHEGNMDATIEGEAAKIAFNSRYLQDVLQVLDGRPVALESTGPSNPGVLRPEGSENYIHVIMPMFVQW